MDLKRFSLGRETNSNTITTHNKGPTSKRRIFLGSLDQPTLHLTSDDYFTFLDLTLSCMSVVASFKNLALCVISKSGIPSSSKSLKKPSAL